MTPYYEDESVQLWHGDCLEVTTWLDADVLVTDPPYGIGWTRNGISRTGRADRAAGRYDRHQRSYANDAGIAGDATTEVREAALTLWGDRPAFVFGSFLATPPPGVRQVGVYIKPKDSGQTTVIAGIARDIEAIYVLGQHPDWKCRGGGRSAAFRTGARTAGAAGGLGQRYGHPHAKPLDVLFDLIALCPPGTVGDPFAGSGSTLVAAKMLGRKAIGVELEERYCEIAANRLSQGVLDFAGSGEVHGQ